jgi:hypothetical protein
MGRIACFYFPLCAGIPLLHFAASDWLLRPELLFRYIQDYRALLCWLQNFAFSYMTPGKEMRLVLSLDPSPGSAVLSRAAHG